MNVRTGEARVLPRAPGVSREAPRWRIVPPMGHLMRTTHADYTAAEAPDRIRFAVSDGGGGATFSASEGV